MICPRCNQDDDKVVNSRSSDGGHVVRRRRECQNCQFRFTTYERAESSGRLVVVKKDGTRVPFKRENILHGIIAACGKRPVSEQAKDDVVERIEREVRRAFDREVPSVEIGKRVSAALRDLDEIAYIRYASEYREFDSLTELATEVSNLQSQPKDHPGQQDLFTEKN